MTRRPAFPLGFCSISALDRPLADVAALAAASGCDGIEVTARPPHLDPDAGPAAARAAGRAVRDAGTRVIAYGSYLGRPEVSRPQDAPREAAIAAALGTDLLRVWAEPAPSAAGAEPAPSAAGAEPAPGTGEGDDFRRAVALLRGACDAARSDAATVVVERHLGSYADTPSRAERLLDAVDRDNLALNYQVLDLLPDGAASAQIDDAARLAARARYVHLKNYRRNPDGRGPLLPGGSLEGGALDYRAILGAVLRAGYRGPMTIEFVSFEPKPLDEKLAADVAFVRRTLDEILSGERP